VRLRPPTQADFEEIFQLLDASSRATFGEGASAEALHLWLSSPGVDLARDVRVAEGGGGLVGYADVDPAGDDPVRWWCDVRLHPNADAEAMLPPLVEWVEERAGSGLVWLWAAARDKRTRQIYARLGYGAARYSYRMGIKLTADIPEPAWPEGIRVDAFSHEQARAVYAAQREVWDDTWEAARGEL
jgi:mycothiol synthase